LRPSKQTSIGFKPISIYFTRVIVRNDGSTEAERVEVSIRTVFKENAKRNWVVPGRFVPLNLRWANTWDVAKAGDDVPGNPNFSSKTGFVRALSLRV
jgi:hypothetical protein